jgi:hypothetical protein
MRCQKFTVTGAEIDAIIVGDEIEKDVSITSITGKVITPRYAKYYNNTGASIGVTLINNSDDEIEKAVNPSWYEPMPLEASVTEQMLGAHCIKIIITKTGAGASTGDLVFYCNNYYEIG